MIAKVSAILGSIRFWMVAAIYGLALYKGVDPVAATQGFLAVVVTIGSLDSFANKVSQ